jgi:predicted KAP-like P-loop ATPase
MRECDCIYINVIANLLMRTSQEIIQDINVFTPDNGNWRGLDNLLDELWQTGDQEKEVKKLFGLFERFPEDDGAGVLWSVLHGIETFKEYEQELLNSLNRQPSHLGIVMVKRILNTGTKVIAGTDLAKIIMELKNNNLTPDSVKDDIKKFLE